MVHNPLALVMILLLIEFFVLYISSRPKFEKYFRFFPSVFWIYFIPMLASTFGLIDSKAPIYQFISVNLLPASLVLLLLSSDIKSILKLEKPALIMMFAGSLGIMLGTPLVFFLVQRWVGAQMWAGFGALSASWIGGSANMIAVKEALGTPDAVFTPMVIVDTVVPYTWMGILVALVGLQPLYDRWNRSDRKVLDKLSSRATNAPLKAKISYKFKTTVIILCLAVCGTFLAQFAAKFFPVIKEMFSAYTWTIVIVSVLGILLSFSPAKKLDHFGASKIGYFMLYFVLTSIGAKANISNIGSTAVLILAGFLIVFIHAAVTILVSRLIRAPMFLAVVSSQANIGGVASAPIVAAIYQPGLASVGLLLAILGNIIGTYLGIVTGQLCHWVAR